MHTESHNMTNLHHPKKAVSDKASHCQLTPLLKALALAHDLQTLDGLGR